MTADTHRERLFARRDVLKILASSGALVSLASLVACVPGNPQTASGPGPVEVKLAALFQTVTPDHTPYFIGQKRGTFKDAGVSINATNFNEPPAAINAVGRDFDVGFALSTQVVVNAFNSGRSELRIIGATINTAQIGFAVPGDSPIQSPADLRGKNVAIAVPNGTCDLWARDMLKSGGVEPTEANLLPGMPAGFPGLWTAAKTGQYATACLPNSTMAQVVVQDKARILFKASDHVQAWTEGVIVTTAEMIQRKRDALMRLLAAWYAAAQYVSNNADEAGRTWAEASGVDAEVGIQTMKLYPQEAWSMRINQAALSAVEEQMLRYAVLKEAVDWQTLVDRSLLPEQARS